MVANFPADFSWQFTGSGNMTTAVTEEIVDGQMSGSALSILMMFLILILFFQSIKMGWIGMLPILVTVVVNFGMMGLFSVSLNIGTALINCLVIGVGVDYSIHYLSRVKKNIFKGMKLEAALQETIHHTGKAILINATIVGIGFSALLLSEMTPIQTMGWLVLLTMLTGTMSTLVLIPATMRLLYVKNTPFYQAE